MAAKRWPYFAQLAAGSTTSRSSAPADDLRRHDGRPLRFPAHAPFFVDRLTLARDGRVDGGGRSGRRQRQLAWHTSLERVGTRTVMLFGPTADRCLGALPVNVTVVRAGLPCEPCWTSAPLEACAGASRAWRRCLSIAWNRKCVRRCSSAHGQRRSHDHSPEPCNRRRHRGEHCGSARAPRRSGRWRRAHSPLRQRSARAPSSPRPH